MTKNEIGFNSFDKILNISLKGYNKNFKIFITIFLVVNIIFTFTFIKYLLIKSI